MTTITTIPLIEESMKKIGDMGYHCFVRYDPERKDNFFTVFIHNVRICDTNDPARVLKYEVLRLERKISNNENPFPEPFPTRIKLPPEVKKLFMKEYTK